MENSDSYHFDTIRSDKAMTLVYQLGMKAVYTVVEVDMAVVDNPTTKLLGSLVAVKLAESLETDHQKQVIVVLVLLSLLL